MSGFLTVTTEGGVCTGMQHIKAKWAAELSTMHRTVSCYPPKNANNSEAENSVLV